MKLSLKQIKRDVTLSPREGTDIETAQAYSECLDQLPPIVVYKIPDENQYLLADGWHRYRAAEILERETVEVEARYGTLEQAKEYALLANLHHGKPLTREEKRYVIEEFLKLHPERSNNWLADDLGTTTQTVINIRVKLEEGSNLEPLTVLIGRDGKQYPRTIEQPKPEEPEEEEAAESDEGQPEDTEEETETAEEKEEIPEPAPMLGPYELNKPHQADCVVGLMGLPENSLDLVFADPPYNLKKQYGKGSNDDLPQDKYFNWCMQWFLGVHRALKPGGAFYVMHYPEVAARWKQQLDGIFEFRRWLSWVFNWNVSSTTNWRRAHRTILYYVKAGATPYFKGEADPQPYKNPDDRRVAHRGKEGTTPYDWWEYNLVKNVSKQKTSWPNQLPLDLVRRIVVTSCPPAGIVCDPFLGSGTTAEAAVISNRDWIGFDVESKAIKITKGRTKK